MSPIKINRKEIKKTNLYKIEKITGWTDGKIDLEGDGRDTNVNRSNSCKLVPFEAHVVFIPNAQSLVAISCPDHPMKTSMMVNLENGLAGINGGFWDHDKKPLDWCVVGGKEISPYKDPDRPCLVKLRGFLNIMMPKHIFEFLNSNPSIIYPKDLEILQAGPLLVHSGQVVHDYSSYVENAHQFDSDITKDRHPRSAFGMNDDEYILLVVDGRSRRSAGLYLEELACVMRSLGCSDAMNLDGGASCSLVVDGTMYNQARFSFIGTSRVFSMALPCKERKISNSLIFKR